MSRKTAALLCCGSVGVSFLITLGSLVGFLLVGENEKVATSTLYHWWTAGSYSLNMAILVETL